MSDAQAKFVATLDSSGVQAGAKSGLTALQRMGMEIQKRSKDLAALKAAQERLAKSAGVQEYLKRQKEIEKTENKAAQLGKKLAAAQENLDIAKQANVSADDLQTLTAEVEKAKAAYEGAREEAEKLAAAQANLAKNDASVTAYKDQAAVIKQGEAELAELQSQYNAAGGSATELAEKIEEPKAGIAKLAEEATKAGGPFKALGSILGMFDAKAMAKAGPLAILAIIIAIGVAAVTATARLAKFAAVSADMARNAARARSSAAFGSMAGTKEIEGVMGALREQTALSKQEAQGLAIELYRAGERGKQLEDTAVTIGRFGQLGEEAQGAIKGFYDELRKPVAAVGIAGGVAKSMVVTKDMLPRDVFLELANQLGKDGQKALMQGFAADKDQIRNALSSIGEQRFAGPALEQMRSLDKLSERFRENLESLFEQLKVGVLLGALQKLVGLLDESSESGKAIRETLGKIAQPIADMVEAALPYIEAFAEGIILGALLVVLAGLKIKNALTGLIPSSLTKNIDWLNVAFYTASGLVITLAIAFTALAVAAFILALPFLTVVAIIALLVLGVTLAIDAIVGLFDSIGTAFDEVNFADAVEGITDGIIKAVEDSAADVWKSFTDLAKGGLDAFKAALGIKSPSLAFRLAGREIPRGAALGVEDEAPSLQASAASMVSPDDMGTTGSGKGGKGGGITVIVQPGAFVANGVRGAEDLNDEWLERGINRILAKAGLEGGLSPEPEPA